MPMSHEWQQKQSTPVLLQQKSSQLPIINSVTSICYVCIYTLQMANTGILSIIKLHLVLSKIIYIIKFECVSSN